MSAPSPLRGIAQLNISADDVGEARDWYARFLGVDPYFQRPDAENPAYVEFRLGDHGDEFGIIDRSYLPSTSPIEPGGAIARWHVDDIVATVDRLKELGAREYEPVMERGEGFVTASVVDPFGNVLGLIHSPHYLESLAAATRRAPEHGTAL
ncbi:VOC family protein [Planctomonas deserti]|uniref:VOC family protein n=1 Tax=Planctomonas deserti TaxID=2144185 RepID=UPI000D36A9AF|nr:VOC family protein [Planctomonas deserti]